MERGLLAREHGQTFEEEYRIVRPDGDVRYVHDRAEVAHDEQGRATYFFGTLQDITERKLAAEALQESARRLQQVINTVPEGVVLLNNNNGSSYRILSANPTGAKQLADLVGVHVGERLMHLAGRSLQELLNSPPQGLWHELETWGRSFEVIARPLRGGTATGELKSVSGEGWVMVIHETTQQREFERRIQQQEQLAAGIAHDFNNILAAIVLYVQMLGRTAELTSREREYLSIIDHQAKHAAQLIQQILDFSRRSVLERKALDLLPLLKEHVKMLKRILPENIRVALACEPGVYVIKADPTRIQQMLTNLALNARDAMPEGGTLTFGLQEMQVGNRKSRIAAGTPPEMEAGSWTRITVSDTGTGMAPEVAAHLFEPFFTTKEPGVGTGLGLAQVHGIVGAHEGHVEVETAVGKGTSVSIYLPETKLAAGTLPWAECQMPVQQGSGEQILVVEDDPVTRKALAESLEMLNYRVLTASNGEEALVTLAQSQSEDVRLVLSDIVMPDMGGLTLLRALHERDIDVGVVLLTGHPLENELQTLREQRGEASEKLLDWVLKPLSLEQLAEVVARVLSKGWERT